MHSRAGSGAGEASHLLLEESQGEKLIMQKHSKSILLAYRMETAFLFTWPAASPPCLICRLSSHQRHLPKSTLPTAFPQGMHRKSTGKGTYLLSSENRFVIDSILTYPQLKKERRFLQLQHQKLQCETDRGGRWDRTVFLGGTTENINKRVPNLQKQVIRNLKRTIDILNSKTDRTNDGCISTSKDKRNTLLLAFGTLSS